MDEFAWMDDLARDDQQDLRSILECLLGDAALGRRVLELQPVPIEAPERLPIGSEDAWYALRWKRVEALVVHGVVEKAQSVRGVVIHVEANAARLREARAALEKRSRENAQAHKMADASVLVGTSASLAPRPAQLPLVRSAAMQVRPARSDEPEERRRRGWLGRLWESIWPLKPRDLSTAVAATLVSAALLGLFAWVTDVPMRWLRTPRGTHDEPPTRVARKTAFGDSGASRAVSARGPEWGAVLAPPATSRAVTASKPQASVRTLSLALVQAGLVAPGLVRSWNAETVFCEIPHYRIGVVVAVGNSGSEPLVLTGGQVRVLGGGKVVGHAWLSIPDAAATLTRDVPRKLTLVSDDIVVLDEQWLPRRVIGKKSWVALTFQCEGVSVELEGRTASGTRLMGHGGSGPGTLQLELPQQP